MTTPVERTPYLPGSRYAAELGKKVHDMRFPLELEQEYHIFYLAERRSHVRSFNVILCALLSLALLASMFADRTSVDIVQHVRVATIAVAFAVLVWAAHCRFYERVYLQTASVLSALIALIAAIEIAHWINAGVGELFALLTAYSIGLYFLAGILYHAAVHANVVMVVAFAVTLALLGEPAAKVAYLTSILAGTGAITGVAFRHQGTRFRRSFLARGLIAEMAARDGLTGLKNRRAFDEHLIRTWQQALHDRRSLFVMMIDVDCFKKFNDRYGHQAGDEALQRIATVVDGFSRRPLDLAARYGGEELALILFDVSRDTAASLAEQLRAAVQNLRIEHSDATSAGVVTVSIGMAIVRPTLERSPDGAVQLADEALYAGKKDGRNRVVIFESEYSALSTGVFKAR
ncbi:MAG: diguanylate cyclase domain-containing protein [Woeseiaceae bacterium]